MTQSTSVYTRIILISGIFLGVFLLGRLTLLVIYNPSFSELGIWEILFSFVHGIRFDASISITFLGIPFMLMMIPHVWASSRYWQGLISWYAYVVLVGFIFLGIGDLIYFGFVQRHAGPEVTLMTGDMELMFDMLLNEHRYKLIGFFLAILGGAIFWARLFKSKISLPEKIWTRYVSISVMFLLIIIIGRGGLQYKPARIADAFLSGSTASGYLTLNGPFAIFHSARGTRPVTKHFMPMTEAISLVREKITSPNEKYVDDHYPLLRSSAPSFKQSGNKPNIVIFMLESVDAIHLDTFRKQKGLSPYSVTPNIDAMIQQGRLFTRFYAAGMRSMDGIAGVLASVPTLPGMPYIGTGMAQNRLSYLAEFAKQQSYQTLFIQSSNRGSFRLDSVAKKAGFNIYLGAEDIPPAHKDAPAKKQWGVWDYSTFMEAHRQFAKQENPFLGFIFSSSTHNPWRVPDSRWQKFSEDTEHNKYLNSLYYADWALGEFMAAAKKHGYYENTIFLITGDHTSGFEQKPNHIPDRYHIPLLIVGPSIKPGIDSRLGSQLDITPTILDMAHWKTTHSSVGRSLFDNTDLNSRSVFSTNGNIIDIMTKNNWLSHNLHRRLDLQIQDKLTSAEMLEKQIQAIHQVVMMGMLENRIYQDKTRLSQLR
ncbi:MAG: sulfatase-like hydrolase/transferase [Gammaproteobacteria bacterium]|nr:sulfatase-like hydrolase/transferase [Gammaproteobacteria bacterium]